MKRKRNRLRDCWNAMHARCSNPKHPSFENYGARGIRVCRRWESFDAFAADMGPMPERMELDRRDNDGHYSPHNCRWVTKRANNLNKRTNRHLTIDGETRLISEWAAIAGLDPNTIGTRLSRGEPVSRAVLRPASRANRKDARLVTVGDVTRSLTEWARESGLPRHTIASRLKLGWSPERAITREAAHG